MADLPYVSDHCILRYLERTNRLDVASIRRAIAERCASAVKAGASALRAEHGQFEFVNGRVVTFTPGGVSRSKRERVGGAA